jgi:Rps23 Pro-64 3,4-dihydroxylase Tpa1-like proline 4-hydroxylase
VWEAASGGALRFNRGRTHAQVDFAPSYNRLLLFLTRPDYVPHQVLLTKPAGNEPRFGMTGWYLTRGDHFSAATQRENDAMKAAASKATSHSQCL